MNDKIFEEQQRKRSLQRRTEARQWRTILKKDPSNLKALENLAHLSCWLRRPHKALSYANAALVEYPLSTEALRSKGHAYLCMNKHRTAEKIFKEALLVNPYDENLYWSLSVTYGLIEKRKEQLAVLKKAVNTLPNNPKPCSLVGDAIIEATEKRCTTDDKRRQARDKAMRVALPWYKKAVIRDPKYAEGWHKYGYALNWCDKYKSAIKAYKRHASLEPHNYNSWHWLGNVYRNMGNNAKAIKYYNQAIQLEPKSSASHFKLGYTYLDMGEKEKAMAECKKLRRLDLIAAKALDTMIKDS